MYVCMYICMHNLNTVAHVEHPQTHHRQTDLMPITSYMYCIFADQRDDCLGEEVFCQKTKKRIEYEKYGHYQYCHAMWLRMLNLFID